MLKNVITLVTGGTGTLGYGVVSRFARKGASVILSDLPTSNGAEIAKNLGENVTFIPADVTSEKDVQQLVDEIEHKYKRLNIIANCAGSSCKQPFYNSTENRAIRSEEYQNAIQTNVIGTYNVCRLAAGLMFAPELESFQSSELGYKANRQNIIINVADVGQNLSGNVIHAVTAHSIIGMTKYMAKDFSIHNIRVISLLSSGFKPTDNTEKVEGYRFGTPAQFGFIVQSLALNGYVNCDSIEIIGGQKIQRI